MGSSLAMMSVLASGSTMDSLWAYQPMAQHSVRQWASDLAQESALLSVMLSALLSVMPSVLLSAQLSAQPLVQPLVLHLAH